MYTTRPGLVLAFHGTDKSVVQKVASETQHLTFSSNTWDWLGHGAYFWENSPARALEFAETASKRKDSKIKTPAVVGAVLDLGYCLDLLDYRNLSILKAAYHAYLSGFKASGVTPLENKPARGDHGDLLVRELDCAVIEAVHNINRSRDQRPFDSVKGVFWEGPPLYPNAGFREKDHIQICVRNPNCIKGFFVPREKTEFPG